MKWLTSLCLLASFAAFAADNETETGERRVALDVGGLQREYVVHIPPQYDSSHPLPVVLMYHGGGGESWSAMLETGWPGKSDEVGFFVVFPEGLRPNPFSPARFEGNAQTWNDGSGHFYAGRHHVDDISFTRALLDDLASRYVIDQQRIYATGFANGASFAFRVGMELPDRIAAIAPVASSGLRLRSPLPMSHPVSLLLIQGGNDPLNPVEGGNIIASGELDPRPPIRDSLETWTRMLNCPPQPNAESDEDGLKTTTWQPCRDGSEVEFLVVAGMGHTWPGGRSLLPEPLVGMTSNRIRAVDVIWDFFARHPRNKP